MTSVQTTQPLLDWDDKFLIGIDQLDFEHKDLLDRLNSLHAALVEHTDVEQINQCVGGIYARLEIHFALEERVMREGDYPEYDQHKALHAELLNDFADLMHELESNPAQEYSEVVKGKLRNWLIDHIMQNDKKMAVMVADKPAKLVTKLGT